MNARALNLSGSLFLFILCGCAHHYYYLPEIDGKGAIRGPRGGIVYAIPSKSKPLLTLRMRALGVHKIKTAQMLAIRLSFEKNADAKGRQFIKPEELQLQLGDQPAIKPAYIHSKARRENIIDLTDHPREVVEVLFPLPKATRGIKDLEFYSVAWKVHFGNNQTESQTARFDRNDAAPQQATEYEAMDPDYPYDVAPMNMPGWQVVQDPFWWGMDPWGPWW